MPSFRSHNPHPQKVLRAYYEKEEWEAQAIHTKMHKVIDQPSVLGEVFLQVVAQTATMTKKAGQNAV